MPDTNQITVEHHINWGGVLKGALIVTAVAVAAVVGFWLIGSVIAPALTGAVTASPGLSALGAGATHGVAVASGWAGTAIGTLVHAVSAIPAGLASILGLTGQHFAAAATVNQAAAIVGGATAGLVATHAALPYLQHGHYIDTDTSVHTGVLATTTVPMHDLSHISHHAAEHADEHNAQWANRIAPAPRVTSYTTFADNVRGSKEERKAVEPASSFTEQLTTDRANLDVALSK